MELTWLSEAGLDTETGIAYTGGQEKYLSAVQRFYRSFEKNRRKIEEALSAQDFESYMITVHAMKSNARMIGAGELSESFEMLEMAARNGETKVIGENNDRVVASYTRLIEGLKPVEALGDVRASDEISAEVARETGEKLLTALEDFDQDEAKRLSAILSGYPFRLTQAEKLKEAMAFIDDFMYDEPADLIREILPEIV